MHIFWLYNYDFCLSVFYWVHFVGWYIECQERQGSNSIKIFRSIKYSTLRARHIRHTAETHVAFWDWLPFLSAFNQIWVAYSKIFLTNQQTDLTNLTGIVLELLFTHKKNWISLSSQAFRPPSRLRRTKQHTSKWDRLWSMGRQSGASFCRTGAGFTVIRFWISPCSTAASAIPCGGGGDGVGVPESVGDGVGVPVSGAAVSKSAAPSVLPEGSGWPISWQCGLMLLQGSRSLSVRSTTEGFKEKVSFVRWSRGNQPVTSTQPTHSSTSVITLKNENATTNSLYGVQSFLRSYEYLKRNSLHFMHKESSLPHSQGPATCPCPELDQSVIPKHQSKSEALWNVS